MNIRVILLGAAILLNSMAIIFNALSIQDIKNSKTSMYCGRMIGVMMADGKTANNICIGY